MKRNAELIFDAAAEDFKERVLDASREQPVVVDFWAEWCSPCIALDPVLKRVVLEYDGAVRLAKVEVDEGENMKLAGRYGLRGFPTVVLFIDGEERGRFTSAQTAHFIREFIDRHLE